jgi:hypothetical protein
MPLADKIKKTQNSFPAQPPGSTVACPFQKDASSAPDALPAQPSPVELETAFSMTQQIMKTLGGKPAEKPKEKKAWIEIILVDAEGKPMPGVRYRITPPGGAPVEGRLNEYGQAGLYQIEPGNCKITFPDLDKDAWD